MKRKYLWLCILLFLPGGCRNETLPGPKTETTRVRVITITPENVSISVHSSGILASEEEIRLSFKTGGIVATINVKEGDKLKKGDILAALNLAEIDANVDMARNGYEKARRDWNRARSLYSDTVATLEQFQNATTALNVAKSNFDIARFNLLHSTIKAPDDGIVLKQLVKQNELVPAGYPVFLFGAEGEFWKVRSGISDRDIVRINPGDSAVVAIDAYPGIKFPAVVDQVSGISNPLTGTFETELNLDGMGYRLASGFIAGVDIFPSVKKFYVMLPVGAIVEADGQTGFIYLVTDSGTVVKHKIYIEVITGAEAAIKGIPEGVKTIVSEGAAYLKDGMKVEIVK